MMISDKDRARSALRRYMRARCATELPWRRMPTLHEITENTKWSALFDKKILIEVLEELVASGELVYLHGQRLTTRTQGVSDKEARH